MSTWFPDELDEWFGGDIDELHERMRVEKKRAREELDLPDCAECGEGPDMEMAEVYDPSVPDGPARVVHVSCIPAGWEIA